MSKYGVISGLYFPIFGLNTEIYSVNLRIESKYREMRTRKNSAFGQFSRSGIFKKSLKSSTMLSFYFLFLRQAEIKVSDFLSIPNDPNLAISKPSGVQTKFFKTSVRPLAKATL